jgi:hypothetical protein
MPADGIAAAIRPERRRRHVPSRRAALRRGYTIRRSSRRGSYRRRARRRNNGRYAKRRRRAELPASDATLIAVRMFHPGINGRSRSLGQAHLRRPGQRRMSGLGQTAKYSLRAYVFRFAPESRHRAMQSACPFRADNVEKVENRTASKISRKLILSHLDRCNAP